MSIPILMGPRILPAGYGTLRAGCDYQSEAGTRVLSEYEPDLKEVLPWMG
ncbi:hypothetical protein ACPOL_0838 [Acidisarcina polymorpha]|uniref:Uncharacterized protein n=1 Tax=Acidisarcina polymorpha TaxID=2211140 RepID=A0A2Z5FUM2_9BACT|nr:hypothetical protein ACPOL_0838 [Acidisarcina polymorpha]